LCVRERERESVCVCVRERVSERERERVSVCETERECTRGWVKACDPLERGEGAAVVSALRGEKKMY